ncbi:MAG TPA: DNA-directed RNA polymerase subunit omega [Thermoanaerobaculia bacterium]|nr:DNA-directed RNA polymerase subunit omega [Thermoanaerobaculia bacterium]
MENLEASKIDSKFRFILLAARRAEQVMRGARPKMQYRTTKVARGAMDEILGNAVSWDYGPPPPTVPAEGETDGEAAGSEVVEGEPAV